MRGRMEAQPLLAGEEGSDLGEDIEDADSPTLTDIRSSSFKEGWCQRLTAKLHLVEEGATPPNWKYIFLMFISLFSSAFSLTYTFPFLPDMMLYFGYAEEEKGYYVGLVASCVFAGRAVGSFFWGWLSDIKGRRLVLLVTIFGNGLFILLFGLATSLPMAMALRFLTGLVNGTVGTAKTVLYEVSDNSNQALGMTTISLAGGFGLILGPFLGGFLASPAKHYPAVFSSEGLFGRLPFFLPSFVGFWVCLVVLLVVFFQFEETLVKSRSSKQGEGHQLKSKKSLDSPARLTSNITARFDAETQQVDLTKSESDLSAQAFKTQGSVHSSDTVQPEEKSNLVYLDTAGLEQPTHGVTAGFEVVSEVRTTRKTDMVDIPLEGDEDACFDGISSENNTGSEQGTKLTGSVGNRIPKTEKLLQGSRTMPLDSMDVGAISESAGQAREDSSDESEDDGRKTSTLLKERHRPSERSQERKRGESSAEEESTVDFKSGSCFLTIKQSRPMQLIRDGDVLKSVGLYTFFSFAVIGYEDVFTVWASTKIWLDGLSFSSGEIGVALGALAIPMLLLQVKLFPMLAHRFGLIKTFLICDVVLMVTIQVTPTLHLLVHRKTLLWVLLMSVVIPNKMASNSCYAATSLLINNSVVTENAGTVNGIAMTTTAVARTFAAPIAGSIFAWTVSFAAANIGAPCDVSLAFFVMGVAVFLTLLAAVFMPRRLNSQKKPVELTVSSTVADNE